MSEQGKDQGQDTFTVLVGPIALNQAEKALAKVIMSHVARIAVMKTARSSKTVGIAIETGRALLIEFAQHTYGVTQDQAILVIDDAIRQARHALRHVA